MSYNRIDDDPPCNHEPDPLSAQQADDSPYIIDYACKHCGAFGSVAVEPGVIAFDEPEELTYTRV